jgi:rhamnosyltransferase
MTSRVLVLLAARNGASWIERQIVSVLDQRDTDVVIDVRDDGSSDATRVIVEGIAARDVRLRLRPDHASSGSAAGNFFHLMRGADPHGFDLIAFCDQDDEWFPDKLARAAARLRGEGADGYSAAVQARWATGTQRTLAQNPNLRSADYLFEGAGQGCTFVMTAALFGYVQRGLRDAGAATTGLHYHDWAVYALARSFGMRWIMDPQPVMTYHQHAANDTGARRSLSGVLGRIAKIRDGWYRTQVGAIVAFICAVNPIDVQARRWAALSEIGGLIGTLRRLSFVARHGRRRRSDRIVQEIAVLCRRL